MSAFSQKRKLRHRTSVPFVFIFFRMNLMRSYSIWQMVFLLGLQGHVPITDFLFLHNWGPQFQLELWL